jgi:hypothetical protein
MERYTFHNQYVAMEDTALGGGQSIQVDKPSLEEL